jgi:outer membrane protein assembly factor BamB
MRATLFLLFFLGGCCGNRQHSTVEVERVRPAEATNINMSAEIEVADNDWPWWRGPNRDNSARGPLPPMKWSPSDNVVWEVEVPGRGHSSPIVVGDRVFVTTSDEANSVQSLLAFARVDGVLQWNKQIHRGRLPTSHEKGSHASSTPACDGDQVFTVFAVDDGIWVSAVSITGEILWQKKIGGFLSRHGYGSSPVLYKSLVIAAADGVGRGYIVALDRSTGDVVWQTPRLREASFGTPIVARVAGRDQLLLAGQNRIVSYDPATGEEMWWCDGSASSTANTVVCNDEYVFASGGWHQTGVMAIRANGSGDVTDTHIAWRDPTKMYVPSAAIVDDILLAVRDDGIVIGFDTASGEKHWAKRLPGGGVSASPTVAAGGIAYLPNEKGDIFVFRVGHKFQLLAKNELQSGIFASPVIVNGRIYLRTLTHLWCIGSET